VGQTSPINGLLPAENKKTAAVRRRFFKESGRARGLLLGLGGGLLGGEGGLLLAFVVGDAALLLDVFVGLLAHRFLKVSR
jgi:hypothetical protein